VRGSISLSLYIRALASHTAAIRELHESKLPEVAVDARERRLREFVAADSDLIGLYTLASLVWTHGSRYRRRLRRYVDGMAALLGINVSDA